MRLIERIALKRMPADALPSGDVYSLLNTVGERLEIDALQEKGEKVSKRRIKKATRNLIAAIDRLTEWPEEPRLKVAAELVAALRAVELDTVAENLLVALQQADAHAEDVAKETEEEPTEEAPPVDVPARIREIIESDSWQLRYPVGLTAEPFLDWRAAMTDEEWVDRWAVDDEEWCAAAERDFGLDVRSEL